MLVDSSANNKSKFSMFREPSYILLFSGVGNMESLIFEGNIAPYFMIGLRRDVRWGIELSPRIIIRMYNSESHPVKTPSFMPRVTFFYQLTEIKNRKRDLFMYFSWFHHSNGQDGSYYNEDSTAINIEDGSFSTNWIEGGVYISRPDPLFPFTTNEYKLYSAYNYLQDKELYDSYGRLRFFFDLQSNVNLSKFFRIYKRSYNNRGFTLKQSLKLGWISGELTDTKTIDEKRLIVRYTIAFKPAHLNDVSFFAQYNYGQDYYNIHYGETLNVIRFGIASSANIFN